MGSLDNKVALITGVARGQGRAVAQKLASEGADIIGVDICGPIETVPCSPATVDDLEETRLLVEKEGRQAFLEQVDVRDHDALVEVVNAGVTALGGLNIVHANAGIMGESVPLWLMTALQWQTTIDINLTGVWNTIQASIPHVINTVITDYDDMNAQGAVVLTASVAGLKGLPTYGHYTAAKHGVIGLMRSLAGELGPMNIRVNALTPSTVKSDMIKFDGFYKLFRPELDNPTLEDAGEVLAQMQHLQNPFVEVEDIAEAVAFLVSDKARFITGVEFKVDAGLMAR